MQQESLRLICLAKRRGQQAAVVVAGAEGVEWIGRRVGGSNQVASESLGTHTKQNATLYFATATMRLPQGRRQRGGAQVGAGQFM